MKVVPTWKKFEKRCSTVCLDLPHKPCTSPCPPPHLSPLNFISWIYSSHLFPSPALPLEFFNYVPLHLALCIPKICSYYFPPRCISSSQPLQLPPPPPFKSNRFPRARSQSRNLSSCSSIFTYRLLFYPENGSSIFLRSVGKFLKDYTVSISRHHYSYGDRCENLKYYQRKWQVHCTSKSTQNCSITLTNNMIGRIPLKMCVFYSYF